MLLLIVESFLFIASFLETSHILVLFGETQREGSSLVWRDPEGAITTKEGKSQGGRFQLKMRNSQDSLGIGSTATSCSE